MSGLVILASASPQRKALLNQIGIEPFVAPADIPEDLDAKHILESLKNLAHNKTIAALSDNKNSSLRLETACWIIGADTVILHEGEVIGKVDSAEQARMTLDRLASDVHSVLTGVCVRKVQADGSGFTDVTEPRMEVAKTRVKFRPLSVKEIAGYVGTGEWRGAAGAYRIQRKGACIVEHIEGSYSNVVGLPIELIYGMLVGLDFSF